jgi:hypothetical protein
MKQQTPSIVNEFIPEHMIQVAMCIQQQNGLKVIFLNKSFKFFSFFRKIKNGVNNATLLFVVIEDIGVLFHRIKSKGLDV